MSNSVTNIPANPLTTPGCEQSVSGASQTCPEQAPCSPEFIINAPCKIVKTNGGRIELTAEEEDGSSAGSYIWSTSSSKIRLINATSPTVIVEGLSTPGANRDSESISVTRTISGCPAVTKTISVTVAKVTFSPAVFQKYGYDDFENANPLDDHISIKRGDYTYIKVDIKGGATGSDFDFICDDPNVCTTEPTTGSSFDMKLNAGSLSTVSTAKSKLHAKVKCPSATSFTHIEVQVYKGKVVNVVVAKIYDRTVAGSTLRFPNQNYAGHSNSANNKLKEAVVKFRISDFAAGPTHVPYDGDNSGFLSWDIANNGGSEFDAIKRAMTRTGNKTRIAIVRDMKSYYYLKNAEVRGAQSLTVTAGSIFNSIIGRSVQLGTGATKENVVIISISGSSAALASTLTNSYPAGASLEFPAGGWGSDPIIIMEGRATLDVIKWTIVHEVGHRRRDQGLDLLDVDDNTSIMHFSQSWTDQRLRYCPRNRKYNPGTTENQWDTIKR